MTQFRILEGKALKSAIKTGASKIATFAQFQHEICYGAGLHLEKHNDATYVQAVYDMMPGNYKGAVRAWFTGLCKAKFDAETKTFSYAKGKASDMDAALATSPADYQKAAKQGKPAVFDEVASLERLLKKFQENNASPAAIRGIEATLRTLKTPSLVETDQSKAA